MHAKSEKEKMLAGELYLATDATLTAERQQAGALCRQLNALPPHEEAAARAAVLRELLGTCDAAQTFIEPTFHCDYGYNIHLGTNFYANCDLVILDVCKVAIGRNCLIGPRVGIYTATHPLDARERRAGLEFGRPITIGNNVWIGGGAIINPGVTIGDDVVIGSGAVVTRDVDDGWLAIGVPARPTRKLGN